MNFIKTNWMGRGSIGLKKFCWDSCWVGSRTHVRLTPKLSRPHFLNLWVELLRDRGQIIFRQDHHLDVSRVPSRRLDQRGRRRWRHERPSRRTVRRHLWRHGRQLLDQVGPTLGTRKNVHADGNAGDHFKTFYAGQENTWLKKVGCVV